MLLARAGCSVTLLERQYFPRAKPCGDCLSPGANRVLLRLGLWDAVLATGPARLSGWRLISPAGHSFSAQFAAVTDDAGAHISLATARDRLDAALLEQA